MKNLKAVIIAFGITAVVVLLLVFLGTGSRNRRRMTVCSGMEIIIRDSSKLAFVTEDDVRKFVAEGVGECVGLSIDSVDLKRIESVIKLKSAVSSCEAYTSLDGLLHIELSQREPLILFKTAGGGFYADEGGFVFPLQPGYSPKIIEIEGDIPIARKSDSKGELKEGKERQWLEGVISLVKYLQKDKYWSEGIKKIRVRKGGCLELLPKSGKEVFIFGWGNEIEQKMKKIEDYYSYIKPVKEDGYYRTVDVRYKEQIVCRQK